MKKVFIILFLMLLLSICALDKTKILYAHENQISAKSEITSVVVFAKGAILTRTTELELNAGENSVVFEPLPLNISDESVRIALSSNNKVKITNIEIKDIPKYTLEELKKKKIEAEQEIINLGSEQSGYLVEIEFVENLISKFNNSQTDNLDIKKLQEFSKFARETVHKANIEIKRIEKKLEELNELLYEIKDNILNITHDYYYLDYSHKRIAVNLVASEQVTLKLYLSYIIPDDFWFPSYDFRLIPSTNKIEMMSYGEIFQKTGEDWKNVNMTLSTAEVTATVALPKFMPRVASNDRPDVWEDDEDENILDKFLKYQRPLFRAQTACAATDPTWEYEEGDGDYDRSVSPKQSNFLSSLGTLTGSIVFKLDNKRTIYGDGRSNRTMISFREFDANIELYARPLISPFVYLYTKIKNDSKMPILTGEMNMLIDSKFVGRWLMDSIAAGDNFELFFGPEDKLKVAREAKESSFEEPSRFRSSCIETKTYDIKVESFFDKPVKVKIDDAIPVSYSKDIIVTMLKSNPEGNPDEMGRITWIIEIEPEKKSEIIYSYSIEYPQDEAPKIEQWSEKRLKKQLTFLKENKSK